MDYIVGVVASRAQWRLGIFTVRLQIAIKLNQVKSSQIKSNQVKSSQIKLSQVKSN